MVIVFNTEFIQSLPKFLLKFQQNFPYNWVYQVIDNYLLFKVFITTKVIHLSSSLSTFTSYSCASRILSYKTGWALKLANNEPPVSIFNWTCKFPNSKSSLRSHIINILIISLLFGLRYQLRHLPFLGDNQLCNRNPWLVLPTFSSACSTLSTSSST
jgi:hypothetical protein